MGQGGMRWDGMGWDEEVVPWLSNDEDIFNMESWRYGIRQVRVCPRDEELPIKVMGKTGTQNQPQNKNAAMNIEGSNIEIFGNWEEDKLTEKMQSNMQEKHLETS